MPTENEILLERLGAAETALHELLLGGGVVKVDYDGHMTEFTRANETGLRRYIAELKRKTGQVCGGRMSRRVIF